MPSRPPLWTPSAERAAASHLHAFMTRVSKKHGVAAAWTPLREWAIHNPAEFWAEMLEFADIQPSAPATDTMHGRGMLRTTWFPGMRLNYARHMLRFDDDQPAIFLETEVGPPRTLTHRALREAVARFAAALRRYGVGKGDRVAGYMPNLPETLIAMLATASLGAIWSSCSPDFGVRGVLDRFGQIEPKVLICSAGYVYGGKRFDTLARVAEMLPQLPSVGRVVVVPYPDADGDEIADLRRHTDGRGERWADALGVGVGAPPLTFEEVPFDHPLFIMYSSGTTGVPKCIVHGHGGTLLQHMKELMLHTDLRRGDRLFYFTTCGWMMWNWLASGLGAGAAIVLYEGNPAHPTIDRLWALAAWLGITAFGTSPKFLGACQKADIHPGRDHDLSALRCLLSTGSPLSVELFEWVYQRVKPDLQLASISGGTDIISCFMLGNPMLPVYAGEIQCRGLAMDVEAWDDAGRSVIGQKGELVCKTPFPSQPVGFWNDPDGAKYRKAYFEHYASSDAGDAGAVWRHGDFIEISETGGVIVYGRSDATLNPGGVRIGTAEIYRIVESVPEVLDSIVIGRDTAEQDVEIILFVVLRPGLTLSTELARRIRSAIAENASKRHVPKLIRQVRAVPVTVSGKKVELAVQQVIHGQEVKNRDALANPDALDEYREALADPRSAT